MTFKRCPKSKSPSRVKVATAKLGEGERLKWARAMDGNRVDAVPAQAFSRQFWGRGRMKRMAIVLLRRSRLLDKTKVRGEGRQRKKPSRSLTPLKSYANVLDHASNDSQFEPRTVSQNLTSTPSPPLVRWWPSSILQRCMGSTNAEACPGEIAFRALPQQRGNNNCYGYVLPYVIVPANSNDTLTDTLLHPSPSSPFLALHPPLLAP
ncbi:hypothetical protein CLAIMM_07695 isoform 1, partial [Cladophialophora immunda]